ncbi:FAD-binding oxidoreductase [Nonomuraea sp. NPDC049709]|uniref:FAD-binding oxidoreductase n=1 Tax=Nonomuraea sp. NPDC049709 TaxID=3154736 RepID=UPI003446D88C
MMIEKLRRTLDPVCPERLVGPGHPRYDEIRQLFNGMHDRRPDLVALPYNGTELGLVIRAAAQAQVPIAVRGSGHNIAGSASLDGGLVIDLRFLNGVSIDHTARVARVKGGATWAAFDAAASRYGLAVTGGTFDTTGVGGLTLGGGIGHLMGKYGLSCDNVLSYALVTADGEHLVVDRERDPELDWALRGAGHNFGVVEEFTFRLHEVSRVYGGVVAYPEHEMAAATRLFRDLAEDAPDELVCILLLERYGPAQEPAAVMSVCYCGSDERYARTLERRLRGPEVLDWRVEERDYLSMQQILGRLPYGLRHYWSARCTTELPDQLIDELVARFRAGRWRGTFNDTVYLEELHGAVRRGPAGGSAVPFRDARFNVTGMAIWESPDADAEQTAWARSVSAAAAPWGVHGDGYVNYVSDAHAGNRDLRDRARRTFGEEGLARLLSVKRRLDPGNLFRSNYNLDPAAYESVTS